MSKNKKQSLYKKPNGLVYGFTRVAAWVWGHTVWKTKVLQNDMKHRDKKRGCIILANHQAEWDFVNMLPYVPGRVTFVMSHAFYNTSGAWRFLRWIQTIPKQQFQTTILDMKRMKAVVDSGNAMLIYPCGLNSEDGTNPDYPPATPRFIKWMNCDIYICRHELDYFNKPKFAESWRKHGTNYVTITKFCSKEELKDISEEDILKMMHEKLDFDCYDEQENRMSKFKNLENAEGLEKVLYQCPKCKEKHSIIIHDKKFIKCEKCGFEQEFDNYGFMHNKVKEDEVKHVSKWSKWIRDELYKEILENKDLSYTFECNVQTIDYKKHAYVDSGKGVVTLKGDLIELKGNIKGEDKVITMNLHDVPCVPNKPSKHIEIQDGDESYRCLPTDGTYVQEITNYIRANFRKNKNISN